MGTSNGQSSDTGGASCRTLQRYKQGQRTLQIPSSKQDALGQGAAASNVHSESGSLTDAAPYLLKLLLDALKTGILQEQSEVWIIAITFLGSYP